MATPKNKAIPATAGDASRGLKVTSKRESFWRAGIQFGFEPKTIALNDITPEQRELIEGEPMLVVQEVDMPAAEAPQA